MYPHNKARQTNNGLIYVIEGPFCKEGLWLRTFGKPKPLSREALCNIVGGQS